MGRIFDPVTVEQAMDTAGNQIEDSVDILDELLEVFLEADADWDREFAQAYLNHVGPQAEKRYAAEVATSEYRKSRDIAFRNLKYAERKANALATRLSKYQSINKSVTSAYNAAGGR